MDFQHGIVDHPATQVVRSDACADRDPEVHRALLEKVFPRQALVTETDEWIQTL
jgi:hypothetical protein